LTKMSIRDPPKPRGKSSGVNKSLQRHQKFRDVERRAWPAQFANVAGPFPPLFCAVIKRALHLSDNFLWRLGYRPRIRFDDQAGIAFLLARDHVVDDHRTL